MTNTEQTLSIVRGYYEGWKNGHCDANLLRSVLAADLSFEGPSGKKDRLDDLLPGLERFAKTVKGQRMLQLIAVGDEAAAIYDCDLSEPATTLRCAELFRVANGRIASIRLVYDATVFRLKAA